ncbi:MAG TPA: trypsin-like peptidase domain-containing protein [Microlunatus sp.]|nr:trypsin-like peptidase domain-containing protein [Microlunatus sp.]
MASASQPAAPLDGVQAAQYAGVAQVREGGASCTGWMIDTASADTPAYVVTNGHCAQGRILPPTAVGVDQPADGGVVFGRGGRTAPLSVQTNRVAYSSMNGTDVSVLELSTTVGRLAAEGITGFRPVAPLPSRRVVTNVGVPVAGVPPNQVSPRIGRCVTGAPVGVIEFGWFFDSAQAVDCPGVLGGSSGSPLFDRATRVVGMINTTTVRAATGGDCWLNKPCERTADGASVVPDTSYAISVQGLSACFPGGRFALAEGCPLPRPGLVVDPSVTAVSAGTDEVTARVIAPNRSELRTGVAPLTDADACADPSTYTARVVAGPQPTPITASLPAEEGFFVWCVADPSGSLPTARVVLQRDLTPPVLTPRISVDETQASFRVQPVFAPPEIANYRIKYGPAAITSCADPAGYQAYRRVPTVVPRTAAPVLYCAIAEDLAGNAAPPISRELS